MWLNLLIIAIKQGQKYLRRGIFLMLFNKRGKVVSFEPKSKSLLSICWGTGSTETHLWGIPCT